ncbi:MAG: hypothetical protein HDR46_05620 [Bacteroides sp.]|nr:hypothetical protein [Bacteroidales bacterium]MBD5187860.1 hypothetical protein [Bacteroidales bacterium]MBD5327703.1 hypothetical protein [Bacteroides sp.]MBD5415748.1 hypothetical protein [Bacteroides sp.]MDE6222376.1 hypothetical protein [Muribaculaceae bacterium]
MNAIKPEQLYLILPYKVSQLAMLIADNMKMPIIEAIRAVYRSNTYRDLSREETKLWHLGPVALFEHFRANG